MGIGTSLFLATVGAILAFAVDVETQGIDLNVAGVILMIVGALGFVLSLVFWDTWWGGWPGRSSSYSPRGDDLDVPARPR